MRLGARARARLPSCTASTNSTSAATALSSLRGLQRHVHGGASRVASLRDSATTICLHARELPARHQARARRVLRRETSASRGGAGAGKTRQCWTGTSSRGCTARVARLAQPRRSSLRDSSERSSLMQRLAHVARPRRSATRRWKLDVVVGHDSLRQAPPARAYGAGPTAQDGTG